MIKVNKNLFSNHKKDFLWVFSYWGIYEALHDQLFEFNLLKSKKKYSKYDEGIQKWWMNMKRLHYSIYLLYFMNTRVRVFFCPFHLLFFLFLSLYSVAIIYLILYPLRRKGYNHTRYKYFYAMQILYEFT